MIRRDERERIDPPGLAAQEQDLAASHRRCRAHAEITHRDRAIGRRCTIADHRRVARLEGLGDEVRGIVVTRPEVMRDVAAKIFDESDE